MSRQGPDHDRRQMSLRTQSDVDAAEALRPILTAGRPERFRLLRVVCPDQHRLLTVYRTSEGPVCVGEAGVDWDSISRPGTRRESRRVDVFRMLDELSAYRALGLPTTDPAVKVECRCRSADIPLAWIEEQISTRRPRVVWPPQTDR